MTPQPIETAPKDGTHILVWAEGNGTYGPPPDIQWQPDMIWQAAYWNYNLGWSAILSDDGITNPTHWLPLPDPPPLPDSPDVKDDTP